MVGFNCQSLKLYNNLMKTKNLRINQLSPQGYEWYQTYLDALDAKDPELYGSFLSNDCIMQMNNADPVEGKSAIITNLTQYWKTFGRLEHDLLNIYGTDSAFMLEALNHYTRLDGKSVTLRAVALSDRNQSGLVKSFRLYTDTTQLFTS